MSHKTAYLVTGVWLVFALLAWFAAVPAVVSVSTFVWVNAIVLAVVLGMPAILRGGQSSRSIGGILYDAEHSDVRK
jgi:hypothetical protein